MKDRRCHIILIGIVKIFHLTITTIVLVIIILIAVIIIGVATLPYVTSRQFNNYRRSNDNRGYNYSDEGHNFSNGANRGNRPHHSNQYNSTNRTARTLPLNAEVPQRGLLGELN